MIYKAIVIFAVFSAACAQMLLKKAATKQYTTFLRQYLNPWVICGYGIMGLAMLANIYAMSKGVKLKEVSIIESLSYLFVPILSWMLFKENVSLRKWGAIAIIMIGVIVFFQ